MKPQPLISVIVPVYNTAPWLRKCLDSICGQTYHNLEILCVNDGSTDESAAILAEYAAKDSRIKVFTQENAGLSAARNTGLEHAGGVWVTGVDSDDWLELGVYERAVVCISPGVDMVFFGVQNVVEDGTHLPHNAYFDLPGGGEYAMSPDMAEQLNVCFWSKLWRRSLLEEHQLRFPFGLVHEDEALYYLYAPLAEKLSICPEIGYYYVQREESIMHAGTLTREQRQMRYVPVLEYCTNEYACRGWLKGKQRDYLRAMFVRLVGWLYGWIIEKEWERFRRLVARLVKKAGLQKDDFRLERIIPVPWWQSPFLSRYAYSKVYRFCGLSVVLIEYDMQGRKVSRKCVLWSCVKSRVKSLLR